MRYCPHCDTVVKSYRTMFDELICGECNFIIAFLDDEE